MAVDYGDGQTQSYTFDAMGNRLQRQDSAAGTTNYAYDAANRLLSTTGAGASAYTNDADGNTLTGGGRTNAWDSQNRLASCTKSTPAGNGGTTNSYAAYTYGADGLRRRQVSYTTTSYPGRINPPPPGPPATDYAYDGTMLVREGRASGGSLTPSTVTATYLIGERGPEYRRDDTQPQKDAQGHRVTKASWYVFDGLGSVVGEVDPLGNLTSSPKYDVYGAVRANGGSATSRQGFVGSLGHVSDTETGLVYMRARYMDPQTGRFVSQDPAWHGANWFVYCDDDPINLRDFSGREPFDATFWKAFSDLLNQYDEAAKKANLWVQARVDAKALSDAMQARLSPGDFADPGGAIDLRDTAGSAGGYAIGMETYYREQMAQAKLEMMILVMDNADEAGMDWMNLSTGLFQGM